jgi:DeoR/GlpR family transcriptional regulator of sugar metabolism
MLLPSQRRKRILEEINRKGASTVAALSEQYDVSETTIRRDLKRLEEEGYLHRTHGGALSQSIESEPSTALAYEVREGVYAEQQQQIARYVARTLIEDGDIIMLEGGTTVKAMVPELASKTELTVVTNSLAITTDLDRTFRDRSDVTIICCGGILRPFSSTFVGPIAESFFRDFHVKKLFLTASGLALESGATDPGVLETQVKKAMIAAAGMVIMIMDSSKFGIKSLLTIVNIPDIDIVVTDHGISPEMKQALEARGVDVHIAPVENENDT